MDGLLTDGKKSRPALKVEPDSLPKTEDAQESAPVSRDKAEQKAAPAPATTPTDDGDDGDTETWRDRLASRVGELSVKQTHREAASDPADLEAKTKAAGQKLGAAMKKGGSLAGAGLEKSKKSWKSRLSKKTREAEPSAKEVPVIAEDAPKKRSGPLSILRRNKNAESDKSAPENAAPRKKPKKISKDDNPGFIPEVSAPKNVGDRLKGMVKKPLKRIYFVSNLHEAHELPEGVNVILFGDATPATTRNAATPKNFVVQPPRPTANIMGKMAAKNAEFDEDPPEYFNIWIREDILQVLTEKKANIYLGIDQFLRKGQSLFKHDRVLMITGGYAGASSEETAIEVWQFRHGRLISFSQRKISPRNAETFVDDVSSLIKSEELILGDQASLDAVYLYKDLDPEKVLKNKVDYLGFDLLASPYQGQIRTLEKKKPSAGALILPVFLFLAAAVGVAGTLFLDYQKFEANNNKFRRELSSFDGDPRKSNVLIERYESYRDFFKKEVREKQSAGRARQIVQAVSSLGNFAFVRELQIITDGSEDYEFFFEVSVPVDAGVSALKTGRPVVQELAALIGGRLSAEEAVKSEITIGKRKINLLTYAVYGDFNSGNAEDS